MRESVQWFAEQMEAKLQEHDSDWGEKGWITDPRTTPVFLRGRISEARMELGQANDDQEIIRKCVKISNFAMMIADQARVRLAKALERKG